MTISDDAVNAALQIEVKKDGLSQMQSGEWVLKLKVHAEDMPTELMTASMGTRYVAVLVEVGDDEQPVKPEQKPKGGRLAKKAGILCGDPQFHNFLMYEREGDWKHGVLEFANDWDEVAAEAIRSGCGVESRSELDHSPVAAERFEKILNEYEAWKRGLAA